MLPTLALLLVAALIFWLWRAERLITITSSEGIVTGKATVRLDAADKPYILVSTPKGELRIYMNEYGYFNSKVEKIAAWEPTYPKLFNHEALSLQP